MKFFLKLTNTHKDLTVSQKTLNMQYISKIITSEQKTVFYSKQNLSNYTNYLMDENWKFYM